MIEKIKKLEEVRHLLDKKSVEEAISRLFNANKTKKAEKVAEIKNIGDLLDCQVHQRTRGTLMDLRGMLFQEISILNEERSEAKKYIASEQKEWEDDPREIIKLIMEQILRNQ